MSRVAKRNYDGNSDNNPKKRKTNRDFDNTVEQKSKDVCSLVFNLWITAFDGDNEINYSNEKIDNIKDEILNRISEGADVNRQVWLTENRYYNNREIAEYTESGIGGGALTWCMKGYTRYLFHNSDRARRNAIYMNNRTEVYKKIIRFLLEECDADPNRLYADGIETRYNDQILRTTPLFHAVKCMSESVGILLEYSADPNQMSDDRDYQNGVAMPMFEDLGYDSSRYHGERKVVQGLRLRF